MKFLKIRRMRSFLTGINWGSGIGSRCFSCVGPAAHECFNGTDLHFEAFPVEN